MIMKTENWNLKIKKLGIILIIISYIFVFPTNKVLAFDMSNVNYILHMANFNMTSGNVSKGSYKLGFTAGETAPGLYSKTGVNYKVRAGFQYIHSIVAFSFAISSSEINFGTLTPGEAVKRTHTLTVTNGSAYGYQVTASENHALRHFPSGIDIPDTTCDSGTCNETTAALWSNPLTYGFGYRCDDTQGADCSTDFSTLDFYKQFANVEKSGAPQTVMLGTQVTESPNITTKISTITYKVNVSSTQAAGTYQNIITYIATPTF